MKCTGKSVMHSLAAMYADDWSIWKMFEREDLKRRAIFLKQFIRAALKEDLKNLEKDSWHELYTSKYRNSYLTWPCDSHCGRIILNLIAQQAAFCGQWNVDDSSYQHFVKGLQDVCAVIAYG